MRCRVPVNHISPPRGPTGLESLMAGSLDARVDRAETTTKR